MCVLILFSICLVVERFPFSDAPKDVTVKDAKPFIKKEPKEEKEPEEKKEGLTF